MNTEDALDLARAIIESEEPEAIIPTQELPDEDIQMADDLEEPSPEEPKEDEDQILHSVMKRAMHSRITVE